MKEICLCECAKYFLEFVFLMVFNGNEDKKKI